MLHLKFGSPECKNSGLILFGKFQFKILKILLEWEGYSVRLLITTYFDLWPVITKRLPLFFWLNSLFRPQMCGEYCAFTVVKLWEGKRNRGRKFNYWESRFSNKKNKFKPFFCVHFFCYQFWAENASRQIKMVKKKLIFFSPFQFLHSQNIFFFSALLWSV